MLWDYPPITIWHDSHYSPTSGWRAIVLLNVISLD
jgi:hypothetical protein